MLKITLKYRLTTVFLCCILFITSAFSQYENDFDKELVVEDSIKTNFTTKLRKLKLTAVKKDNKAALAFTPIVAWNNYDKTQLGVAIFSSIHQKFDYAITPMFATATKTLTGTANFNYRLYGSKFNMIEIGAEAKRFSYQLFPRQHNYQKAMPHLTYVFKQNSSNVKMLLGAKSHLIWMDYYISEPLNQFFYTNELFFEYNIDQEKTNLDVVANFRQGELFGNASTTTHFEFKYKKPNNGLHLRFFGGVFLWDNKASGNVNPPLPIFQLSGSTNAGGIPFLQKDYLFEEYYFDRNGIDPFFQNQVAIVDGGFKSITSLGNSRKWLTTVGAYTDIPIPIPIQPFVNMGMYSDPFTDFEVVVEAGFTLTFFKDFLQVHLPLVTTKNIRDNQSLLGIENFYQRFTFTLDLKKLRVLQR